MSVEIEMVVVGELLLFDEILSVLVDKVLVVGQKVVSGEVVVVSGDKVMVAGGMLVVSV